MQASGAACAPARGGRLQWPLSGVGLDLCCRPQQEVGLIAPNFRSRLNADVRSKSTMRPAEDQYSMREPALERPQCHRNRPHARLCVSGVRALLAPREHGAANPWFSCTHSLLTPAPWHNLQLHLDLGCRAGLPLHGPRPGCSGSRTDRDLRPCAFSASRWPASGSTWPPTCRSWGGSRR